MLRFFSHPYGPPLGLAKNDINKNLDAFRQRLEARGYTTNVIKVAFAAIPNRENILKDIRQQTKQLLKRIHQPADIPFVVKYSQVI